MQQIPDLRHPRPTESPETSQLGLVGVDTVAEEVVKSFGFHESEPFEDF